MSFDERYVKYLDAVNEALPEYLPDDVVEQKTVADAMAYSLLGSGKRIRAILALAFCEQCGGDYRNALPFACAVEMVHAYSLIHDDLPCMDDDDIRRGKPSCHIAFGEGMAVLAGDALLTHAFSVCASARLPAHSVVRAVTALSEAAGVYGMLGGQVIDIEHEGKPISEQLLKKLHTLKTGAMIRAAAQLGCIAAGADEQLMFAADSYARNIGLAFQIVDDILDATSTTDELGKSAGSDAEENKTTFATLFGIQQSRDMVKRLVLDADKAIKKTVLEDEFFFELADRLAVRKK